jgi:hypothetical protein
MKTTEIKRGEFKPFYDIKELKMSHLNRDVMVHHSENFKIKLKEFGWMMPIVVSKGGDIIEGHHRVVSAKILKQKTVPAYIVDWVDTNNQKSHLNAIINLNNGNKAWNTLDYLKAFSKENEQYKIVYDAYLQNQNTISAGNAVNVFFGSSRFNDCFKKGTATIKDLKFSLYILNKISNLVNRYGKKNVQAYCVREMINIAFTKIYKNYKAIDYLFTEYGRLAKMGHPSATSITQFRPIMEENILIFNKIRKN